MDSSLHAQFKDLKADVGFFLGYGRGPDFGDPTYDSKQTASLDRCIKGGMRKFYFCGYPWSFLKPVASLTLVQNANTIHLPEDYGGKEGKVVLVASTAGTQWFPIDFLPIGDIYLKQAQLPTTTGRPVICCEEPLKGTTGETGQRFQFRIWPIADQNYTLQFQYYVNPDYLSGAFPFAYGGTPHSETLLESCLAVAEKLLDDQAQVHDQEFIRMLAVSKELDMRNKPKTLGYNRDLSDVKDEYYRDRYWRSWSPIYQNGVLY